MKMEDASEVAGARQIGLTRFAHRVALSTIAIGVVAIFAIALELFRQGLDLMGLGMFVMGLTGSSSLFLHWRMHKVMGF